MSRRFCLQCDLPIDNDNHLFCVGCRDAFRAHIRQIPELLRELNVTLAKQDRIGSGSNGGSRPVGHERPLVYKQHASEARDKLIAEFAVRWAKFVREHFVRLLKPAPEALAEFTKDLPTDPIALLIALTDRAANYEWFAEMAADAARMIAQATNAIDLVAMRLEAGRCDECSTRISGRIDSPTVTCPDCGAVYDIEDRQRYLYGAARGHDVTAHQAEVFLGFFLRLDELRRAEGLPSVIGPVADQPFNGALVRQWARRGHLDEAGRYVAAGITTAEGWPTYRFGDVMDVATAQIEKLAEGKRNADLRRAERAAARGAREMARMATESSDAA